jgi:hypothetical protein
MNAGLVVLTIVVVLVALFRYSMFRRRQEHVKKLSAEIEKDISDFLAAFNPATHNDFSALDFRIGQTSLVAPFPNRGAGEWRYTIYLEKFEVEDEITILHEIVECTIGRVIEKLLNLDKPLYLKRKEDDEFWIPGKRRKYVLEHVVTTLCEAVDVDHHELKDRLAKEDFAAWFNPQ